MVQLHVSTNFFFETPCINQLDTGYLIYNYREDKKLVNIINYT